ncbi:MAG: NAD-dependent succinate-semialdehyde dehydrogenase [Phycisphaeraceae bacterium]
MPLPPGQNARALRSPLIDPDLGYIAGQWVGADSGKTVAVINPATGEHLADVPNMGKDETLRAVSAGEQSLKAPTTIDQRRGWLLKIAQRLKDNKEELGRIITLEHGKPWKEAQGEVEYAAGFFQYCGEHIDALKSHPLKERPRNHDWTVHYRPAGVVALITPWNFPIAMLAKKLSAALAADCASIAKPASKTPLTMIAFFTLLAKLDLPAGKVNLLIGSPQTIGDVLCQHPSVRLISFTGSTEVGRLLLHNTADYVKRLTLELGGNAPFIVFDDADLDAAADHLMANKFRGSGQTCVCANRVYVHRLVVDAFAQKLAQRVKKLKVGNGLEPDTDIGPLIDENAFKKVKRHVDDAIAKGALRVVGEAPTSQGEWGNFFPPTVLRNVTKEMACVNEETFGPLVPLLEFETEAQAIERGNDTEYGLAAYVFTKDTARAQRVIRGLRFGHVGHNTGTGPAPEAPFGGMKQSGFGREGGREGLFEFVEPQTVPAL